MNSSTESSEYFPASDQPVEKKKTDNADIQTSSLGSIFKRRINPKDGFTTNNRSIKRSNSDVQEESTDFSASSTVSSVTLDLYFSLSSDAIDQIKSSFCKDFFNATQRNELLNEIVEDSSCGDNLNQQISVANYISTGD